MASSGIQDSLISPVAGCVRAFRRATPNTTEATLHGFPCTFAAPPGGVPDPAVPGRGRPSRPAPRRHAGFDDRRRHRIPAGQRAHRSAVPGRVQADDDRQRHVQGRLGARELRRNRDGAFARAPGVQGHADTRQHPDRARQARHAVQRIDEHRPHQLFRVVHGQRREPRLGAGDGSGPDGQFVHPQERPRPGNDGRAQRVRERREQSAAGAAGQDVRQRLPMAQLRAPSDRRALGHRERQHRAVAGVLQNVLPARQRRADRRRQVRRRHHAGGDSEVLRAHPQAGPQASGHLHGGPGAGRRAHGDAAPRGQRQISRHDVPHGARRRPGLHRHRRAGRRADRRTRRPALQGAGGDAQGGGRGGLGWRAARSGNADVLCADPRKRRHRPGARRDVRHVRRPEEEPDHRGRSGADARTRGQGLRRADVQSAAFRRRHLQRHRARRLAPVLPAARPLQERHRGRRAARRAGLSQALERDGRRIPSRCRTGPRARAACGRRRGHGQGLQGRRRRGSRRDLRHQHRKPRRAHAAVYARQRHEGRAAAQEDPRRRRQLSRWRCISRTRSRRSAGRPRDSSPARC